MTQSRQALHISVIYSIPLLLWFGAQLRLIDWNSANLTQFCRQAQGVLILLQVLALALLFVRQPPNDPRDDVLSILLVTLYPLPFLAVIWLSGSASATTLAIGLALVGAAGGVAFMLQAGARLLPAEGRIWQTCLALVHLLLASLVWNFRAQWQGWLQ
jgi:hypothetical protein